MIVPPELLSECSDVTDGEEVSSDDGLEAGGEDAAFLLAQEKGGIVATGVFILQT